MYQRKMLDLHIAAKNIDTKYNNEKIVKSFLQMKGQLSYLHLSMLLRTHEFGAADVIPKDSDLSEKPCQFGCYIKHAGGYGLSACCACLNVRLYRIMHGHPFNFFYRISEGSA